MRPTRQLYLLLAWLIALTATVSTLYASLVLHQIACPLCWYQRICIYPLTIILGIAAFKDDKAIIPYAISFPILGALFAVYHYLEQLYPGFGPINFCGPSVACSFVHLNLFGFLTYPLLSLIGCAMIFILLLLAKRS